MLWLITEDAGREMQQARKAGFEASGEKLLEFMAAAERAAHADEHRILTVAGSTAEIRVVGALTPGRSLSAWLFGGANTRYSEIQDALAAADADPVVKSVVMFIDSPGGTVDGLFETLDAIRAFGKPITVRAVCACSAAYAIAAVAAGGPRGNIEAVTEAAYFGSVGVVSTYIVWDDEVDITSTHAPDKRPDVKTEEGKAVVRKHLDEIHTLFVEAIASGRGTSVAKVNEDFGRGAVMLARSARANGLIDRMPKKSRSRRMTASADDLEPAGPVDPVTSTDDGEPADGPSPTETSPSPDSARDSEPTQAPPPAAEQPRKSRMDQTELKAQHPELFAAVFAAGRAEGATKGAEDALIAERDRVGAHLTLGGQSGDMETALEAITSGAAMTQTLTAKYLAAGMNRADITARQEETDDASKTVDGVVTTDATEKDLGDLVADKLEEQMGIK